MGSFSRHAGGVRHGSLTAIRWALGGVVLGATQLAMTCGPADPGPCGSDRFNCDDGDPNAFIQRTDCGPIEGPLTIELGGGYNAFVAFDVSGEPPLERGGQGGQHLTTSYRVRGANLAESDRLRISLRLIQPDTECGGDTSGDDASTFDDASGGDTAQASCEAGVGQRVMTRGGTTFPLKPDADGVIVESGIIVILESWGPLRFPFRLVATVEDLCGRIGTAEVAFPGLQ